MPVARLPASVLGGCGHLLLMMQVCFSSATVLKAHTQLFWTDVEEKRMSTTKWCSCAQVGQRAGALSGRPSARFIRRAQYWQH